MTSTTAHTSQDLDRNEVLRGVESEVGALIQRVKRVLSHRAQLLHPEMSAITYFMLSYLAGSGPTRASDLADAFDMDKSSISRHVQHLVDLGFIERTPDPDDRRAQLLAATPEARTQLEALRAQRSARFDERLGEWSLAELVEFRDMLTRYNAALSAD